MTRMPPSIDGLGRAIGGATDGPATESGAQRRQADSNDARRFSEMMRDDARNTDTDRQNADGNESRGHDSADRDRDRDGEREAATLSSPFDLLHAGGAKDMARAKQAVAPRAPDLQRIVDAVADRILVRDDPDAGSEVRIQLKESLLPGVEVRIRHDGGRLTVEFVSTNADSTRFLDGQRGGLASLLEARLKSDVEVRVTASDGTDGGGDTGDGRSRNSYVSGDDSDDSAAITDEFDS